LCDFQQWAEEAVVADEDFCAFGDELFGFMQITAFCGENQWRLPLLIAFVRVAAAEQGDKEQKQYKTASHTRITCG